MLLSLPDFLQKLFEPGTPLRPFESGFPTLDYGDLVGPSRPPTVSVLPPLPLPPQYVSGQCAVSSPDRLPSLSAPGD